MIPHGQSLKDREEDKGHLDHGLWWEHSKEEHKASTSLPHTHIVP